MEEVKTICKKYNVNVRNKLFENEKGIHHTDKELKEYNKEIQADHLILLQITSPLRDTNLIEKWIEEYLEYDYDIGFAADKLPTAYCYRKYGTAINYIPNERTYNGCEKESIYKETGSFYIFKVKMLNENHIMNADKKILFEDPYDFDIDTYEDLENEDAE